MMLKMMSNDETLNDDSILSNLVDDDYYSVLCYLDDINLCAQK